MKQTHGNALSELTSNYEIIKQFGNWSSACNLLICM
jgi:hypothetical protein